MAMLDHLLVIFRKDDIMIQLQKTELLNINGGSISGNMINAFSKAINTILDLGRSMGTAIRRIVTGNLC